MQMVILYMDMVIRTTVFFNLNCLLFENVNMSKRDAYKQMVPCG